ncbi:hypothetical protein PVAP13_1NG439600 [Panicum virgatum]|uniref:MCAfunc domain-containing protein n=1 Tax=Panicum virgatum TaxID=38727 RepID=A0A8T0X673_PANVG|nr:hypothetical protein PVAP13_1NG439600 [Panicum virgatum]
MQHLETRRPLQGLEKTLRQAQRVVAACQGSAAAYRFLMAGRHAGQLRDVADDIDSYLLLIPLVSQVHNTRPAKPAFPDAAALTPCSKIIIIISCSGNRKMLFCYLATIQIQKQGLVRRLGKMELLLHAPAHPSR